MSQELTYRDIVSQFLTVYGYTSDDSTWSEEFLIENMLLSRATQIKQLQLLGLDLGIHTNQTIPCVKLEEVDRDECPSSPPSGCTWLKSTCPIPKTIGKLTSVTDVSANRTYNYVAWDKVRFKTNSRRKATREGNYYTLKDTGEGLFLYILNDCFLKLISVSAIFEDPYCAATFCDGKEGLKCNPLDTPFKTDGGLVDTILEKTWTRLTPIKNSVRTDWWNDDQDNTKGEVNTKI